MFVPGANISTLGPQLLYIALYSVLSASMLPTQILPNAFPGLLPYAKNKGLHCSPKVFTMYSELDRPTSVQVFKLV